MTLSNINFDIEMQYLTALIQIQTQGETVADRTGVGTKALNGLTLKHDFSNGFPLLTTKKIHIKSVLHELLWFLKGDTNIKYLTDNGVTIWNEWADENGDLGPVYGHQWRNFNGVDQIALLLHSLKTNPNSRRHIVSAWNPVDVPKMGLPACHALWQVHMNENNKISLTMYQRSADFFLGVPFNIASYAFLLTMLGHCFDRVPHILTICFGDAHLYLNHMEAVDTQVQRTHLRRPYPRVNFAENTPKDLLAIGYNDFVIENYNPLPAIKADIAV